MAVKTVIRSLPYRWLGPERVLRRTVLMLCLVMVSGRGQLPRMVIEGSIQLDGASVPNGAVVRVLRNDGTVVRTVNHYRSNPSQFGVRLGLEESLIDGEPLSFRVVLSRRDSFEARIVGGPLVYRGSPPQEASVTRILLFRNHAPQVRRSFPDTTIKERQQLRWRVLATDQDGDTLRYRLMQSPPGAQIEPLTGYVTYVPTYDDSGVYPVEVAVSDAREEIVMRKGRVRVEHVNRPPRITRSAPNLQTTEGRPLTIALPSDDPDGDSLNFSLIETSYRFRLFSRNGAFEWTPDFDAAGMYSCYVVVSDGSLADTSNPFTVTVEPTDRPPAFAQTLRDTAVFEQQLLVVDLQAQDPDGDGVRYQIELAPEGVSVDDAGVLRWVPSYDQAGNYIIVVSANDAVQSAEAVLRVTVLDRNRDPYYPTLAGKRDTMRIAFGRMIDLNWRGARDPDGDESLRYTLRLWGGEFDTSIAGVFDTSMAVFIRGRLELDQVYSWTTSVSDGFAEAWSPDTGSFRLFVAPIVPVVAREAVSMGPRMFTLEQPASNPTGGQTIIRYALTHRSHVDISLYTMLGERVTTIVNGERVPGQYETTYDAGLLASGVYLFKLEAHPIDNTQVRDFVSTKKMVLVR